MKLECFKDVRAGSPFGFAGDVFLKIKEPWVRILGREYNSVRTGTGDLVHLSPDDKVTTGDIRDLFE